MMKTVFKIIASLLLLFNSTGALYGGLNLIMHPDGSSLHMSLDYLKYSLFNSYFIPGIILFVFNGLFSFLVLGALIFKHEKSPLFVIAQGSILTGWIILQVLMVKIISYLHIVLGITGLL